MKLLLLTFIGATFINFGNGSLKKIMMQSEIKQDINIIDNNKYKFYNGKEIIYNLKQAVFFEKNRLSINKNQLNKTIWPKNIYSIITSDQYQKWLQGRDNINRYPVINEALTNSLTDNKTMHAWSEYHWYWFAYWRLHLTKTECDVIANALDKTSEVTSVIGDFLEQAGARISKVLIAQVTSLVISFISNDWVTKNGMTIHFLTLIPVYFESK